MNRLSKRIAHYNTEYLFGEIMIALEKTTSVWNELLINDIITKLNIGLSPEVMFSNDAALRLSFLSAVVRTQQLEEMRSMDDNSEDGDIDGDIEDGVDTEAFMIESSEPPEQDSEMLDEFLEYVGASRFKDELLNRMQLTEFESRDCNVGFDFVGDESGASLFNAYFISFVDVAEFFEENRFPISKKLYMEFIYDSLRS